MALRAIDDVITVRKRDFAIYCCLLYIVGNWYTQEPRNDRPTRKKRICYCKNLALRGSDDVITVRKTDFCILFDFDSSKLLAKHFLFGHVFCSSFSILYWIWTNYVPMWPDKRSLLKYLFYHYHIIGCNPKKCPKKFFGQQFFFKSLLLPGFSG